MCKLSADDNTVSKCLSHDEKKIKINIRKRDNTSLSNCQYCVSNNNANW